MPLNPAVPTIERKPGPDLAPVPIARGRFLAWVPQTFVITPAPQDRDPLEHVVEVDVDVIGGRLVCTRCELRTMEGGPVVTTDALRRVPVGRYIRDAAAKYHVIAEVDPEHEGRSDFFRPPPKDFAAGGMTDAALVETARIYHWTLATGDAPLGVLERDYGIPRAKASRWIATARRRGLIEDDNDGR